MKLEFKTITIKEKLDRSEASCGVDPTIGTTTYRMDDHESGEAAAV